MKRIKLILITIVLPLIYIFFEFKNISLGNDFLQQSTLAGIQNRILIITSVIVLSVIIFKYFDINYRRLKIQEWAEENKFNFIKELPTDYRKQGNVITEVIWGIYQGNKFFFFNFGTSASFFGNASYFNGIFYKQLNDRGIVSLLSGKIKRKKLIYYISFQSYEMSIMVKAELFLNFNIDIDFQDIREIYVLAYNEKSLISKDSFLFLASTTKWTRLFRNFGIFKDLIFQKYKGKLNRDQILSIFEANKNIRDRYIRTENGKI